MKKIVSALLVVMMLAAFVVGCGGNGAYSKVGPDGVKFYYNNLEEYMNTPVVVEAVNEQMDQGMAQYKDVYSAYGVETTGNVIKYYYNYVDGVDVEAIKTALEDTDFTDTIVETKKGILEETGIEPEAIAYEYRDVNGTVIFSAQQ